MPMRTPKMRGHHMQPSARPTTNADAGGQRAVLGEEGAGISTHSHKSGMAQRQLTQIAGGHVQGHGEDDVDAHGEQDLVLVGGEDVAAS